MCEAAVIVVLLHLGHGLLAMTSVMGISELIYIFCCYRVSHRVVPEMQISPAHFTKSAFPELIRFAGSYQLVNVLELLYGAILPIVLLKFFGAEAAGGFAVAYRVVTSALIGQDALVLPILSGGTMVFASGSTEQAKLFLAKAFKVTLAAALLPLAFVAAFGTAIKVRGPARLILSFNGHLPDRAGGASEGDLASSIDPLSRRGPGPAG